MIKQGIKNYFVNLKYVFTIIGVLALGIIIGLSILIPQAISAATKLCNDVVNTVSSVELDGNAVGTYLIGAVRALDWSNPLSAVNEICTPEWLTKVLNGCMEKLVVDTADIEEQLLKAANECLDSLLWAAALFVLFTALGLIGGFYFTKWLVRRDIAKRTVKMFILITLLDAVFSALLMLVTVWLAALWWKSVFISAVVTIVLEGFVSLTEAYIAHGRKKFGFKEIVNVKNTIKLWISDVCVFLISIAFAAVFLVINVAVGIVVGMALVIMAFIVIRLNADAYVKALVPSKEDSEIGAESKELAA